MMCIQETILVMEEPEGKSALFGGHRKSLELFADLLRLSCKWDNLSLAGNKADELK